MLDLPGSLNVASFLQRHWQKKPLFMPGALPRIEPRITRNELAWLATLDDVESRLVFTDRSGDQVFYRAETGPFDEDYLQALPKRDWTLLVHDVEKHLPIVRKLFRHVPFIPDWRIDDLMISFAAPGGGVGPHRDNYDVFLCQGTGVREWRITTEELPPDSAASDDLALLTPFPGDDVHEAREGDVLYVPPGVAHWGTATRACMTYSIGMRAPQAGDIAFSLDCDSPNDSAFYQDPDLRPDEARPGYLSDQATARTARLLNAPESRLHEISHALGCLATQPKDWLRPDSLSDIDAKAALNKLKSGGKLEVHGMALLAFDERNIYVNGSSRPHVDEGVPLFAKICADRAFRRTSPLGESWTETLIWMLKLGAFEIPELS